MFLWNWICRDDKMDMMYVEDCCEILDFMRVPIVASEREKGKYPYYGANGIQDYVADYIFDDELVLLAEDGGNFGSRERPIAYRVSGKCWVNNHAHVLKPKDELDVDYLCYSLMFYKVDGMVNGATRQKLTQAAMRKMQIPSRSMDEQKQIVDELNRIIRIKKQRQKELVLLDDLIKARFVEMFGDPIINSRHLETKNLQNVLMFKAGDFTAASDISDEPSETNPYPCYGGNGIRGYVSEYNQDGEYSLVGRQGALSGNVQFAVGKFKNTEHALLVTPIVEMNNTWLNHLLLNLDLKRYQTGAAQPGLSVKNLQEIQIICAPIDQQNQFADFVRQTDKSKVAVQKALDETQMLFDSLMQEYFG